MSDSGQMVTFGPGPSRLELPINQNISLEISNSIISTSYYADWVYGGYAAVRALANPAQTVSMTINNSTIDVNSFNNRINGVLIESGWDGSGSGYLNLNNSHVSTSANLADVGSAGVGVTAKYIIAEIKIDKKALYPHLENNWTRCISQVITIR